MATMTKLGKYLIKRELGKGAMGVVYEGFDPVIERKVAIKTILQSHLNSAEVTDIMTRFKREAQSAGRLNHPGIVGVYDYGEVVAEDDHTMVAVSAAQANSGERVAFIAMEFVQGQELRDYFERGEKFQLKEAARIMVDILDALGHAHQNGVVHRDMKPANLMLQADGRVKIADFGIARIESSTQLTQVGTPMGTPAYMSPEQWLGQTVDGRSDLYSCGVILYQFLTGERPFTGVNTTIMYKVLNEEPAPASALNVTLPAAWDAVVKKAMAKKPDNRYQTAKEFATAIQAALNKATEPQSEASRATDSTVVNLTRPGVGGGFAAPAASASEETMPSMPTPPPRPAAAPLQPAPQRAAQPVHAAAPEAVKPAAAAPVKKGLPVAALVSGAAAVLLLGGGGAYFALRPGASQQVAQSTAPSAASTPITATATPPAANTAPAVIPVAMTNEPGAEPGTMIISALGLADPKDPKFKGDAGAAQSEARADASRQLVEKALALYVDKNSINQNYGVIETKLLSQSGNFIKSVIREGAPVVGKDGLVETETRAVIKMRDVQKSLNQLSKEERIDFIRNNGDPKVSISMAIGNAETSQMLPNTRSVLAENVLKERIKSFGFRVWSNEGETSTGAKAQIADFTILGEAKLKQVSMKLPASGLTVSKSILTSWTLKAVDKSSGEEIYLNTLLPKGQSWSSEDAALADIGKQMGDEFSKNFFLQHFNFKTRKTSLSITGLPDKQAAELVLRELRSVRQVLDVQLTDPSGKYALELAEGSASDILQDTVIRPLNAKLGQNCFALAGASGSEVNATFAAACSEAAVRGKLETVPPAGLWGAPDTRGKALLKGLKTT